MKMLSNKRIILGVSGGIAAYKSADLVRRLKDDGAMVRVVMSQAACEFVTPLTFQALSGHPVHTRLLDHNAEAGMGHIELARWGDLIVIAPATANVIARLAQGNADDLLTTMCLAASVPVCVVPAMNRQMWLNQPTRENIQALAERGVVIIGPADGDQACGEVGPGRMLEPSAIVDAIRAQFRPGSLAGTRLLVTAGPTREAIDPVRYLSNHSSGRMGYAVAAAAVEAGAKVILISGPVSIPPPERVRLVSVVTALDMHAAIMAEIEATDIFISAAAVADFRSRTVASHKIKKDEGGLRLELEKNPDILAAVAALSHGPFTVGFAAETSALQENARLKLEQKGLDIIAANLVGEGRGFNATENALEVFWSDGHVSLEKTDKEKLARRLIQLVADRYHEKNKNKIA